MTLSSSLNMEEIQISLSAARLDTYLLACPPGESQLNRALELYAWNAQVSAALLTPLHICEVIVRNAVSDVLTEVYGERWPWSEGFERSLPTPNVGYNPARDLFNARRGHHTKGKVIPELKFVFWQKLFTRRFDQRLWQRHLRAVFTNISNESSIPNSRALIYSELDKIRFLRNRIAHHEPIFTRSLLDDFNRISGLIRMRSVQSEQWMIQNQFAVAKIHDKPDFS